MKEKLVLPSGRTLSDVITGVTVKDRTTERSDAVFMANLLREMYEPVPSGNVTPVQQRLKSKIK